MPLRIEGRRVRPRLSRARFKSVGGDGFTRATLLPISPFVLNQTKVVFEFSTYQPKFTPVAPKRQRIPLHLTEVSENSLADSSASSEERRKNESAVSSDTEKEIQKNKLKILIDEEFSLYIEDENGDRVRQVSDNSVRKLSPSSEEKYDQERKLIKAKQDLKSGQNDKFDFCPPDSLTNCSTNSREAKTSSLSSRKRISSDSISALSTGESSQLLSPPPRSSISDSLLSPGVNCELEISAHDGSTNRSSAQTMVIEKSQASKSRTPNFRISSIGAPVMCSTPLARAGTSSSTTESETNSRSIIPVSDPLSPLLASTSSATKTTTTADSQSLSNGDDLGAVNTLSGTHSSSNCEVSTSEGVAYRTRDSSLHNDGNDDDEEEENDENCPLPIIRPSSPGFYSRSSYQNALKSVLSNKTPIASTRRPLLDGYSGDEDDSMGKLLNLCNQTKPMSWQQFGALVRPIKLGEGSFGEVYKVKHQDKLVALKVLPMQCEYGYQGLFNGDKMSAPVDVIPEVIISRSLSSLRLEGRTNVSSSFVDLHQVSVVQGVYPKNLVQAWDKYAKTKESENEPSPSVYGIAGQLYLLLSLELCGSELETLEVKDKDHALSIVLQVTLALCIAQRELEFEHRDLHLSNVLCMTVRKDSNKGFRFDGKDFSVKTNGTEISIIDFTLSRFSCGSTVVYRDLSEDTYLFEAEGNLQFDVYRWMKEAVEDDWSVYCPKTNIFWIHYLTHELMNRKFKKAMTKKTKAEMLKFAEEIKGLGNCEELISEKYLTTIFKDVVEV